jgi:hypothetical protein
MYTFAAAQALLSQLAVSHWATAQGSLLPV